MFMGFHPWCFLCCSPGGGLGGVGGVRGVGGEDCGDVDADADFGAAGF